MNNRSTFWKSSGVLMLLFGLTFFLYDSNYLQPFPDIPSSDTNYSISSYFNEELSTTVPTGGSILILFWNHIIFDSHPEYILKLENGLSCQFTANRSLLDQSHLVVFHFHGFAWGGTGAHVPESHRPGQRWVFYTQEAPGFEWNIDHKILNEFGTHFNVTATFLQNADIDLRYGYFIPRKLPLDNSELIRDYAANRNHLVAWLASNCQVAKLRKMFVEELAKFIKVDVFGGCGVMIQECQDKLYLNKCLSYISQRYKFYLALENSDCEDYITEKLWKNAFFYNMIPIVRGKRNNYEKLAPPGSYINADLFTSAKELANYLMLLDKDHVLYNNYFKWKQHYEIYNSRLFSYINQDLSVLDEKLCYYAHQPQTQTKWYNISEYYNKDKLCV